MPPEQKIVNSDVNERKRLVLLTMLDQPAVVAAMARGAGLTVDEVKEIMCRLVNELGGGIRH